jgi:drug/metabolite transporter (DMT)-like permease
MKNEEIKSMIEKRPSPDVHDEEQQRLNTTISNANDESIAEPTSPSKHLTKKNPNKKCGITKSLYGIPLAIGCAVGHSIAAVIVKKSHLLSGSEQTTIRYLIQMILMSLVICYKKLDIRDYRSQSYLLATRAFLGVIGLISAYFALSLIDPADSSSIINSSIVITAILSRVVLGEKMSIVHVVSIFTAVVGIVFISQPSFIFPYQSRAFDDATNQSVYSNLSSFTSVNHKKENSSSFNTAIGLMLASFTAFALSGVTVILKKLSTKKVHYSVNILFTSMLGLPVSILLSLALNLTAQSKLLQNARQMPGELATHVLYSCVSSVVGVMAQVMFNLSLQYEDASKVSIIKTSEIFFSFLLQYLLLSIESNVFKIVGGVLIFISGSAILTYKIFDQKHAKRKRKRKELMLASGQSRYERSGCCARFLFSKF